MPPRVCLTMIVKDEEANLPTCLASAADLVDEIVVVDTGSSDRTREVAARFGARVFDFAWGDDFSAARNESLRRATADWIFWLDADDRLDQQNRRRLQTLLAELADENAAYIMQTALLSGGGTPQRVDHIRLFRNHPNLRWRYRVHEQIRPAIVQQGAVIRRCDVTIDHTGYQDASVARRKTDRNLRLLLLDYAEQPNNPDILFHMGKSYLHQNRPAEAIPFLKRSLEHGPGEGPTHAQLHLLMARAYRQLGDRQRALAAYRQGRQRHPDHPELLFEEGCLRCVAGDFSEAEACLVRLLNGDARRVIEPRVRSIGHYNLAVLYHQQGRFGQAVAEYRTVLELDPDYADARKNLAVLLQQTGRGSDDR